MAKKTNTKKAKRGAEWCVIQRYADGSAGYYYEDSKNYTPPLRFGRQLQAQRFETEADAAQLIRWLESGPGSHRFEIVKLPPASH